MRLLVLALIPLAFFGCRSSKIKVQQEKNWSNPEIHCNVPSITESITQEVGGSELTGNLGLENFCERMGNHFSSSNISASEAEKIYEMILLSGLTLDESFGMPDPNLPQSEARSIADLTNRISILKIDDTTFEIFFKKIGCGISFVWGRFVWPSDPKNLSISTLESWRASFPC
jgi:hypothetical protein